MKRSNGRVDRETSDPFKRRSMKVVIEHSLLQHRVFFGPLLQPMETKHHSIGVPLSSGLRPLGGKAPLAVVDEGI